MARGAAELTDTTSRQRAGDRGRDATDPSDIPVSGWRDVLLRVKRRVRDDNLSITSAGVAFYAVIATFPALLALSSVYGLVFDLHEMAEQLKFLEGELQPQAMQLLIALLRGLVASERSRLGLGIAGGVLISLWGTSLGVRALIRALNVAYAEKESRSLLQRALLATLLTLGAVAMAFGIGLVVLGDPVLAHWMPLTPAARRLVSYARWPAVAVMFWLSLLVFYRYGPSRAHARWSWVSWGAVVATALWLSGSGVLAWYVAGASTWQHAYGSAATIVLVLAWFLLSAFSVLLGAEINAELERQTRKDTTDARGKPIGQRGATAADTVGEAEAQ